MSTLVMTTLARVAVAAAASTQTLAVPKRIELPGHPEPFELEPPYAIK